VKHILTGKDAKENDHLLEDVRKTTRNLRKEAGLRAKNPTETRI